MTTMEGPLRLPTRQIRVESCIFFVIFGACVCTVEIKGMLMAKERRGIHQIAKLAKVSIEPLTVRYTGAGNQRTDTAADSSRCAPGWLHSESCGTRLVRCQKQFEGRSL